MLKHGIIEYKVNAWWIKDWMVNDVVCQTIVWQVASSAQQ
jgi:hypothetical protein